jgi:hypothetical protein
MEFVRSYREERERQVTAMEEATKGYLVSRNGGPSEELVAYLRENGPMTNFKQVLIQSKRPEAPVEIGDKAEAARITQMRRAEMDALKVEAEAEERRYQAFIAEVPEPTLKESRDYTEIGLLGSVMAGGNIEALRKVRGEFSDPFHGQVAIAILDRVDAGLDYDAPHVTQELRERGQLPIELDTSMPLRSDDELLRVPQPAALDLTVPLATVDHHGYGIGSWQSNGIPYEANDLAVQLRNDYICRYLADAGAELAASATLAAQAGDTPGPAFVRAANKMVNVPRPLDRNLNEAAWASTENVDTEKRQPRRTHQVPTPATVTQLGLPPRPELQTTARQRV